MPPASGLALSEAPEDGPSGRADATVDDQAFVVELFGGVHTRLRIGVKFHLLAVLDAFTFPSAVIGPEFSDHRMTRSESPLDYSLRRDPIRFWLVGPYEV
jgi:hypothetical protein